MLSASVASLANALKGKDLVQDADYFVEICARIAEHDSSQEAQNLMNRLVEIASCYSPVHRTCC